MKELPRRPIEPLSPPPGSFDAVLARARYRRHRRVGTALSVAAVFFAGIAGGTSLNGGVSEVRNTIVGLATNDEVAAPPQQPTNSAVVTPEVVATPAPSVQDSPDENSSGAVATATPPPKSWTVDGVAVDAAGQPIAGLYVYPGRPDAQRFLATREPAGRTSADGSFSLPCPGTPVLLSPWPVNVPVGQDAGRAAWAATFIGGGTEAASAAVAPCRSDRKAVKTTVLRGSTFEGTVTMPEACADARLPLWVWLHNDRSLTVRLPDLASGDAFSLAGLPPGQHTVGANGNRTSVTVGGGSTVTDDVRFSCEPGSPPETPAPPTTMPTPLPTPSETPTPTPTSSTSTDPEPSGSSVPQASPTGTAAARP